MPDEFQDWLDKCPLSWVMLEITKEKGTYVFFINENESWNFNPYIYQIFGAVL